MPAHRPTSALRAGDVPPADAPWDDVVAFGHGFHAYKVVGSLPGAARITDEVRAAHDAGDPLTEDLTRLRTALFVTLRASGHGHGSDGDRAFCRALVESIRSALGPAPASGS